MKIVSWNINGLRSLKMGIESVLQELDADIVCFQETKVTRDLLPESSAVVKNFNSFFSFCKNRSGYSGVATYCKYSATPSEAQEGLTGTLGQTLVEGGGAEFLDHSWTDQELKNIDAEGRCIITQHLMKNADGEIVPLTIINVYCPRVDPDKPERMEYKLKFYEVLKQRAFALTHAGSRVLILGDINASHKKIDHCDPDETECFEDRPDRKFLDQFIVSSPKECEVSSDSILRSDESIEPEFQVVDTFRYFYPDKTDAYTCWNTRSNARSTNYGTRIDYIFCTNDILSSLDDSFILSDVQGSDHCPIGISFKDSVVPVPSHKVPDICTKFYPEFQGQQQKLLSYFTKASNQTVMVSKRKCEEKIQSSSKQMKLNSFFKPKTISKCTDEHSTEEQENDNISDTADTCRTSQTLKASWSFLGGRPKTVPNCPGHNEPAVLRTVKKKGPNLNKQFYACSRGAGKKGDANAQCNFFQWY